MLLVDVSFFSEVFRPQPFAQRPQDTVEKWDCDTSCLIREALIFDDLLILLDKLRSGAHAVLSVAGGIERCHGRYSFQYY